MYNTPFMKRMVRRAGKSPLTATAACAALVLLTFGTSGCGGAGTPGLSPTINRPPDTSDANRDGRGATIATGRMGVFLTATTFDAAPPAAQDDVPTSADMPAGSDDAPVPDAVPDGGAKPKATTPAIPTPPATEPVAAPDEKTTPLAAPETPATVPAAPPAVPSSSAPTDGDEPTTPPSIPAPPVVKPDAVAPTAVAKAEPAKTTGHPAPVLNRAKTTDAVQTYRHIWATILKIELLDAGDKDAVTVWEDTNGLTLDLQTLHDKNGRRFSLVTSAAIPSGRSYDRVRVTMGNGFELFTPGSDTGVVAPLSDTLARDSEGRPIVSFGLAKPRDLGTGKENLFVDFDLRKLQIDNGRVLPVVRESGSKNEIVEGEGVTSRQNANQFAGIVTEWTPGKKAGEGAFTLATLGGKTVTVQTTSATGVWNDDGKPSPLLANNKRVRIAGRLSTQNNRVIAETVDVYPAATGDASVLAAVDTVKNGAPTTTSGVGTSGLLTAADKTTRGGLNSAAIALASEVAQASAALASTPLPIPPAQVVGMASHGDETGGTLTLTAREVGGIVPTQSAVTVQVVPGAILRGKTGMTVKPAAFFAELNGERGMTVRAEGDYEAATGTLKASRLVVVPAPDTSVPATHEVMVQGVPTKVSIKNEGSLQVANLTEWDNIAASDGKNPVHIVCTAATALRNESGEFIARENFFKAIENPDEKDGINVRVAGTYTNGVLTATRIDLRPAPNKSEPKAPPTVAKSGDTGAENKEVTAAAKTGDGSDGDEAETPAPPPAKNGHHAPKAAPASVPVDVPAPPAPAPPMPVIPAPPVVAPSKGA